MALQHIQNALARFYAVDVDHDVEDFVCDEVTVTEWTGEAARGEVLVVAEDEEGVRVGLFVDSAALETLKADGDAWLDGRAQASALATEGVSHFLYLMFRARREEQVSQLELELQAEVDKYLLAAVCVPASSASQSEARSRTIRRQLFHGQHFIDEEGSERGERYRVANRVAARYARALEDKFVRDGNRAGLRRELQQFYRGGLRRKLEMAG